MRAGPVPEHAERRGPARPDPATGARLAELSARLSRCGDLDTLVEVTVGGLAELPGYRHTMLLLVDEHGQRLLHDRQPRLRRRGSRLRGRGGRGHGRHSRDALHSAANRQSFSGAEVHPGRRPRVRRAGDRPGYSTSLCLCSPTSKAASPCRPWRWATWLACSWRKARSRSRSTRPTRRSSAWWRRSLPAPSTANGTRAASQPDRSSCDAPTADVCSGDHSHSLLPGRWQHVHQRGLPDQRCRWALLWSLLGQHKSEGAEFRLHNRRSAPRSDPSSYRSTADNFENRLILLKRRLADAPHRSASRRPGAALPAQCHGQPAPRGKRLRRAAALTGSANPMYRSRAIAVREKDERHERRFHLPK